MKKALTTYFNENNLVIKITGFLGIIASLFLQITNFENRDLKIVQVFLLLLFGISVVYLLIDLVSYLFKRRGRNYFYAFITISIGIILVIFSFHFLKFIFSEFNYEITVYFKYYSILLLFGSMIIVDKIIDNVSKFKMFHNKKFRKFLFEFFSELFLLLWFLWIFKIDIRFFWIIFVFVIPHILNEIKIISGKVTLFIYLTLSSIFLLVAMYIFN